MTAPQATTTPLTPLRIELHRVAARWHGRWASRRVGPYENWYSHGRGTYQQDREAGAHRAAAHGSYRNDYACGTPGCPASMVDPPQCMECGDWTIEHGVCHACLQALRTGGEAE